MVKGLSGESVRILKEPGKFKASFSIILIRGSPFSRKSLPTEFLLSCLFSLKISTKFDPSSSRCSRPDTALSQWSSFILTPSQVSGRSLYRFFHTRILNSHLLPQITNSSSENSLRRSALSTSRFRRSFSRSPHSSLVLRFRFNVRKLNLLFSPHRMIKAVPRGVSATADA